MATSTPKRPQTRHRARKDPDIPPTYDPLLDSFFLSEDSDIDEDNPYFRKLRNLQNDFIQRPNNDESSEESSNDDEFGDGGDVLKDYDSDQSIMGLMLAGSDIDADNDDSLLESSIEAVEDENNPRNRHRPWTDLRLRPAEVLNNDEAYGSIDASLEDERLAQIESLMEEQLLLLQSKGLLQTMEELPRSQWS